MILNADDIIIHLERPTDAGSQRFLKLTDTHKLCKLVCEPTHDQWGLLVVVLTTAAETAEDVTVSESGLSDHKIMHWSIIDIDNIPMSSLQY